MGEVVLPQSPYVEIVQDAGGVFNMEGKENGCVGRKQGYIYILEFRRILGSTCEIS